MDYEYIANQLLLLYQGGRPTVEGLDVREIIPWVKEAHASVGRSQFYENYKADNQHTVNGQWLVSYDFPIRDQSGNIINIDPVTGYVFVELLEDYLQLPKNRGIVRVSIKDPSYKGSKNLSYIQFENYENLRGGQTMQFAGRFMYSVNNKKIFILPTGLNNTATINFNSVVVTTAVANETTMNDGMVMLMVQQLLPIMNQRFGRKPDMVTDFNPNAS